MSEIVFTIFILELFYVLEFNILYWCNGGSCKILFKKKPSIVLFWISDFLFL